MATANDLRRGMAINYNGDICVVLDMQHRTPGNLRAFVQATLRSIRTGKSSDVRFSSTEKIEPVPMITKKMEFSYKDGEDYVFTDPETTKRSPSRRNWSATRKIISWKTPR
jgi:elongation factor P